MKVYQDITLLPDTEANLGFLWQKVFTQVHLAFVEANRTGRQYGVAFPDYGQSAFPLGNKLRVFGFSKEDLYTLNLLNWLDRFHDYCHVTSIREVPEQHQYVAYRRKQFCGNAERLARRRARRHNESFEQSLKHFDNYRGNYSKMAFIRLPSLSTEGRHLFRLHIDVINCDVPKLGVFNTYGLSKTATVPCF